MPLLPPTVVGPISACNSSVRVQGQNIGANVDLFESGSSSPIGGGVATWSDQAFPLNSGVQLTAGQTITATQTQDGQTSQPSSAPLQVQSNPEAVGAVALASHIYQCGQALRFFGAVPGATVQVIANGQIRGQGVSPDGTVRVILSAPTQASETLVAIQTACGITGPSLPLPQPDSAPVNSQGVLSPPTLQGALVACQTAATIKNAVDGANITITETPGSTTTQWFPLPTGLLIFPPLAPGGTVTLTQTLPGCQIGGAASGPIAVSETAAVPAPSVVGPLCAGSVFVQLTGLIPGAQVEIFQGGVSLGTGTCFGTSQYFSVPVLVHKQHIQATQQLCSNVSALSNQVKVGSATALAKPSVQKKLLQCASVVQVSKLNVGAVVYVFSKMLGAPIGIAMVTAEQMDVQVAPLLMAGDAIFARQEGCGKPSKNSASVIVAALPNQGPPALVAPIGSGSSSVFVQNVTSGARIDVYVNNQFRGTATATSATVQIDLGTPLLNVGDQVSVRETTCEGMLTGSTVIVAGCQCSQVSKTPIGASGSFLYTFNCATPIGTTVVVQIESTNDIDALQQAELGCDSAYGD